METQFLPVTLPLWTSKRSLERFRESILSYANTESLQKIPIFSKLVPEPRLPQSWLARWRNVQVWIHDSPEDYSEITQRTNDLRDLIPNFNYQLMNVVCDPIKSGWITPPCPGLSGRMIIDEYTPGLLLSDLIRAKPPFLTMFSIGIQIIRALEIAREKIGFVHGQLTPENIIIRPLPDRMKINYDGLVLEDDQYPVLINFEYSNLNREGHLYDLYNLLVNLFYGYYEFPAILNFYNVGYIPTPDYPPEWWIDNMIPQMIDRSANELISLGYQLGYRPVSEKNVSVLEAKDIPGYGPVQIDASSVRSLIAESRRAQINKYGPNKGKPTKGL